MGFAIVIYPFPTEWVIFPEWGRREEIEEKVYYFDWLFLSLEVML